MMNVGVCVWVSEYVLDSACMCTSRCVFVSLGLDYSQFFVDRNVADRIKIGVSHSGTAGSMFFFFYVLGT